MILSTHIMQEVQALCDRVVIINRGNLVANDSVKNLTSSENSTLIVEFSSPIDAKIINEKIPAIHSINDMGNNSYKITHEKSDEIRNQLFDLIKEHNWQLTGMKQEEASLESIFQNITNEQ